jgi:hypothetical protein
VTTPRRTRLAGAVGWLAASACACASTLGAQEITRTIDLVARDFTFTGMPTTVPAGLARVRLDNRGANYHHVILARLDGPITATQLRDRATNAGAPIAGVTYVGGPEGRMPTGSSEAIVRLVPGRYVLMDLVEAPDGVNQARKGMFVPFTVTGRGAVPALEPPRGALSVVLTDHAFTPGRTPVADGPMLLDVTNLGTQEHHLLVAELEPGKTLGDVYAFYRTGARGAWPHRFVGGTTRLSRDQSALVPATITKDRTFLICVNTDPATGKPHVLLGMLKPLVPTAR